VIIPRGPENEVAIDLIAQHIIDILNLSSTTTSSSPNRSMNKSSSLSSNSLNINRRGSIKESIRRVGGGGGGGGIGVGSGSASSPVRSNSSGFSMDDHDKFLLPLPK